MTMITALASALVSVVAVARRQVASMQAWSDARADYRVLCEMDDATLADLGLTRGDLRDATAVGYFGDPTLVVASRAAERAGQRRPVVARPAPLSSPPLVPEAGAVLRPAEACR